MSRRWTGWLALILLGLLLVPALVAQALTNSVALSLLHATPCAPQRFLCLNDVRPHPPLLEKQPTLSASLLGRARIAQRLAPSEPATTLRYAEALFATGQREQAAALLPAVDLPSGRDPSFASVETLAPATRSRLLAPWRTEGALIAAYKFRAAGYSDSALAAFRQALALGAPYLGEADHVAHHTLATRASTVRADEGSERLERLVQHLRAEEIALADEQMTWLATHGPTYRLTGGADDAPLPLPLVGYDLDKASLAAGGQLTVWLWWQAPAGQVPPDSALLAVGSFWVERQTLVNLAPNPMFTWPATDPLLPAGYYTFHHPAGLVYQAEVRQEPEVSSDSHALHLTSEGPLVLRSFPFPLDTERPYLAAAWLRREGTPVVVGRQCFPRAALAQRTQALRNYLRGSDEAAGDRLLVASDETNAAPGWQHLGRVVQAPAGTTPLCQLYLEQQAAGESFFTHLLFAPLESALLPRN